MKYYIGVDGGGTKSTFKAKDSEGNTLFKYVITGSNFFSADRELLKKELSETAAAINKDYPLVDCEGIYFGLAAMRKENEEFFTAPFHAQGFKGKAFFGGDAEIGLYTHNLDGQGILMISGTGSVCEARKDGKRTVVGGWGHLFGDEGSAYWISSNIIRRAFHEADGRSPQSGLTEAVLSYFEKPNTSDLVTYLYNSKTTKKDIAAFAKYAYENLFDNPTVKEIFKQAAEDCYIQIALTLEKSQYYDASIVLNGSVLTNNSYIKNIVEEKIKTQYPDTKLYFLEEGAVDGSIELCKKLCTENLTA